MPVHDWSRVDDGIFHDFHLAWIAELRRTLNSGLLPPDLYALAEQIAGSIGPDVITLQSPRPPTIGASGSPFGGVAVAVAPPRVQLTLHAESGDYTRRRRTILIRHRSDHRIIALIEILSPGNKASYNPFRVFLNKAAGALRHGIHLLLIDLLPPTPRDPHGLHVALWEDLTGKGTEMPPDKPLTLAAYVGGPATTAYIEPVAVGDTLPEMPLFLTPDEYINVPLEQTYLAAYEGVPRFYREILEA